MENCKQCLQGSIRVIVDRLVAIMLAGRRGVLKIRIENGQVRGSLWEGDYEPIEPVKNKA